jgi:hypothetical protein
VEPRRHAPIAANARSCCCPSEPVAQVILALPGDPSAQRAQAAEADILLCAHHLRASAGALLACGASVYDRGGNPIDEFTTVFAQNG